MNQEINFYHVSLLFFLAILMAGCSMPSFQPTPSATPFPTTTFTTTPSATPTLTSTLTPSLTPTQTLTPTPTETFTPSSTPTITQTPTKTATPTDVPVNVTLKMQANCHYGPGIAYLYRWGLYPNDTATVDGKNWDGTWFWIKPGNLDAHCWASEIVFNETINKSLVPVVQIPLPKTTFAGNPGNVKAVRAGDKVTVTWNAVNLSEDKRRGYLLEVNVCNGKGLGFVAVQTDNTSYTFTDKPGCKTKSSGLLYTAEKHGYSSPAIIRWP